MKKNISISIIVPVFNEEKTIAKILEKILTANTLNLKKEIIIINDGSTDNTSRIIKKNLKKQKQVKIINNSKNYGKGYSLKKGFLISTGDIVLVQDSDLEYTTEDYPRLISPFLEFDADVVYGSRFVGNNPKRVLYFWHYIVNIFLTLFSNMFTNLNLTDMETGFKVFKGKYIRKIAPFLKSHRFGFEPEITARLARINNIRIYEVGISYFGRTYKDGKKINYIDGIKAIFEIVRFNIFK